MNTITMAFGWYMVFLFSLTFHEAAHAYIAKMGGDLTAYRGGQVTLNPVPHVRREPLGMILIPVITFFMWGWMMGWASAPYNPLWAIQNPRRAGLMSLAGPAANLALVIISGLIIRFALSFGLFVAPQEVLFSQVAYPASAGIMEGAAFLLSVFFSLNLVLFVFNLIPFPPLDGSGALMLFVKRETAIRYRTLLGRPAFMLIGLFIIWRIFGSIFSPIFTFALNMLYPGMNYH